VWAQIAPSSDTPTDDLARETLSHQAEDASFWIKAQINERKRVRSPGPGGSVLTERRTIRIRRLDADAQGWTPTTGDKVLGTKDRMEQPIDSTVYYIQDPKRDSAGMTANADWVAELVTDMPRRNA